MVFFGDLLCILCNLTRVLAQSQVFRTFDLSPCPHDEARLHLALPLSNPFVEKKA